MLVFEFQVVNKALNEIFVNHNKRVVAHYSTNMCDTVRAVMLELPKGEVNITIKIKARANALSKTVDKGGNFHPQYFPPTFPRRKVRGKLSPFLQPVLFCLETFPLTFPHGG